MFVIYDSTGQELYRTDDLTKARDFLDLKENQGVKCEVEFLTPEELEHAVQ
jgi:hypothetical protein